MATKEVRPIDWRAVLAGLLAGTLVALVGFLLLRNQRGEMGTTLFFLSPVAAGFAAGLTAKPITALALALVFTFLFSTLLLLITKAEGWCAFSCRRP